MKYPKALFLIILILHITPAYGNLLADDINPATNAPADTIGFVCLDSNHVSVEVIEEPLPSDSAKLEEFLWQTFAQGPEPEKFTCPVSGWALKSQAFIRTLIRKAAADSLDSLSLKNCLGKVMEDRGKNAYLPIGAKYMHYRNSPVWVILVNWEWTDVSSREVLGHIRVYVMDAHTFRKIAFVTCS